jgi:integrase
VSLLLLFRLGLRKGELARVQFKHYEGRNLTMFGKGGKVRYLPVVERVLRLQLEQHILDRQPEPDEFLLHPEKTGLEFYGGPVGVIWQDRCKQLSSTAMQGQSMTTTRQRPSGRQTRSLTDSQGHGGGSSRTKDAVPAAAK